MQIVLNPNLLINPAINGPKIDKRPQESELAHATADTLAQNEWLSGSFKIAKAPKRKPSETN